ncbi:Triosephosphate isomerase [Dipodascopsis uninucleata]
MELHNTDWVPTERFVYSNIINMNAEKISGRQPVVGISLKMYFNPTRSISYLKDFKDLREHLIAKNSEASIFIVPDFLALTDACKLLPPEAVAAQDCCAYDDEGAYTGEISAKHLAELGCGYVEVGHAERRALFHETDELVNQKVRACIRNGLTPLLCVGEKEQPTDSGLSMDDAIQFCVEQIVSATAGISEDSPIIVAYEPVWAIGKPKPAPISHTNAVCDGIRKYLDSVNRHTSARIIYGGSANPGLFSGLDTSAIDGMFVGRFGHQIQNFEIMVNDVNTAIIKGKTK